MRPTGGASKARVLLAFLVLMVLAAVPLLSVDLPPLVDFPNHLARMYVLADGGHTPSLAEYYTITWEPLPNLAMDAIVPWLLGFMPLFTAGRLFLLLLMVMTASGMMMLHRTLWGRWSYWPLLGFGLLYNRILIWGFVNFLFGLGLALWVLAFWAASRRMHWLPRLVLATIAATAVFFCHIEAQGLLFFALCGMEAPLFRAEIGARRWGAVFGRLVMLGGPFVPAAIIFFASWQPHSSGHFELSTVSLKLQHLLIVFSNYHWGFDVVCALVFVGFFALMAATRRAAAAPPLFWWLGIMITLYVLMPNSAFTGSGADERIPVLTAMLLVAGSAPKRAEGLRSDRLVAGAVVVLLALFVLRLGAIEQIWLRSKPIYADDAQTLSLIKPGSRMGVADPWAILADTDIPQTHIPLLAVPMRNAFVPPIFAYPAQQPIRIAPAYRDFEAETKPDKIWAAFVEGNPAERKRLAPLLPRYDYLLFVFLEPFKVRPDPCLQFMRGSPTFQLYRVVPQHGACPAD
ncbi:MAG TPA: hypothetical protein VL574_15305 [Stellaceae bacterium]|nr:hypothetical protein [Stellaceae bacterium]